MKHLLSILFIFILSFSSKAQQNLVPNPSFEDTVYCPWGTNQLDACENWLNFGNSPDYFNTCTGFGGPPFNYGFGDQNTHTGNAMVGIAIYVKPSAPSGPNYREFVGIQLSSSLIIGQKYYYSFYTNYAGQFQVSIACNKMGLNFSTVPFGELNPPPLLNTAHLFTDSILVDSVSWVRLSGSFIADSAYQYLGIGNYFDDSNTDTINTSSLPFQAYYYIDDICVSTDSLFNEVWTGTLENETINQKIETFPNPAKDKLNISAKTKIEWIRIINLQGIEISNFKNIDELNLQINVSDFKPGLYFVSIKTQSSNTVQKLLIEP
jgi:Secretion system C-terminal sorting domain